jgi:hypothetical protein
MSVRRELRVDVSDAVGTGERRAVAATVVLPNDLAEDPGGPRTVTCVTGPGKFWRLPEELPLNEGCSGDRAGEF